MSFSIPLLLADNPEESTDVAPQHPEIVAELGAELEARHAEVLRPDWSPNAGWWNSSLGPG